MKKRTWKRALRSVTNGLLIAAMLCSEALAGTVSVSDNNTVTVKDYTENTPVITSYSLYDASGNVVNIGSEVAYDGNIAALRADCGEGQMNASKNACFATEADAKAGIAKITFDIVGNPLEPGKDVLFVLDESGSMNMGSNWGNSIHMLTSPCLEPSHFYMIPANLWKSTNPIDLTSLEEEEATEETAEETQSETTAPDVTEGEETTTPDVTEGEETTAPEETEGATTAPEETEGATTAPEETEGATTAPEETEGATTVPEETEGATTAPEETEGATTAPEATEGATSAPEETEGATSAPEETEGATTAPEETEGATTATEATGGEGTTVTKETEGETTAAEEPETATSAEGESLACRGEENAWRVILLANESDTSDESQEYFLSGDKNYYIDREGNIYFTLKAIGTACGSVEDAFETWDNWSKEVSLYIGTKINAYFEEQGIDLIDTSGYDALGNNGQIKGSWIRDSWQPWNNHYHRNGDGSFVRIPCPATSPYCSPGANNAYGCFDRMMMEKDQVSALARRILNAGTNDRVAAIGFNDTANVLCNFTKDTSGLNFGGYAGGGNTRYETALKAAYNLLDSREDKTRQPIVVFISDGSPWPEEDEPTSDTVKKLEDLGATVYAVGIRAGSAMKYLTDVGGDNTCNCKNVAEFIGEMEVLYAAIVKAPAKPVLADIIGENYTLLVNGDHPITVGNENYYSLDTLPKSITYNSDSKTFTCSLDSVDTDGLRISFYVQLAEECRTGQTAVTSSYATNGSASLTYYPATKDESGTISYAENPTTLSLDSPSVKTQTSLLPAQVVSDKMIEGQPVTGQVVKTGDEITYTITVTNNGVKDATDVVIVNPIPEGTEYQSCTDSGAFADGTVTWTIPEIKAGESATVSFTVKVTADDTDFVEDIITEQFTWGWKEDTKLCNGNVLKNPTPVPGTLVITNTIEGNAADPNRDFRYTITYTNAEGEKVTENFTLKGGESKTLQNLPEGSTYTITQADANQDGYTTNQKTVTGTIVKGETQKEDYVNVKNVGSVTVTNTVTGNAGDPDKEFHYTVTFTDADGKETVEKFTLTDGQTKTFTDLPDGTKYVVTQTDANEDGYKTNEEQFTGTIDKDKPQQADFENEKNTGTIVITNTVEGKNADPDKPFHYTITYTDEDGVKVTEEFTLKHGEEKTFPDVLADTPYHVVETDANQDGYTANMEEAEGTVIGGETVQEDFVNVINPPTTGSVMITNTVTGNAGDPNKPFHYTVTFTDADGNKTAEEFTLTHGQTKTFTDLPDGTKYVITQTDANQDGYVTPKIIAEGTIEAGETAKEDYLNSKNVGSVIVTNTVEGNAADPNRDFHYTITYTDSHGQEVTKKFTLKHGEEAVFSDLLDGTDYTVTQTDADQDGYYTNMVTTGGRVVKDETAKADYLNVRNRVSVSVAKEWADANNRDGIRPGSVTVCLLANGEDTGRTLVLSAANGWQGSFTDLEMERRDGSIIHYTVEEESVQGYSITISGDQATGFTIRNRHVPLDPDTPKTGDTNNPLLWNLLLIIGAAGYLMCMVGMKLSGKRRRASRRSGRR